MSKSERVTWTVWLFSLWVLVAFSLGYNSGIEWSEPKHAGPFFTLLVGTALYTLAWLLRVTYLAGRKNRG